MNSKVNLIDKNLKPLEIENNQSLNQELNVSHRSDKQKQSSLPIDAQLNCSVNFPKQVEDGKDIKENYFMGALMMFM